MTALAPQEEVTQPHPPHHAAPRLASLWRLLTFGTQLTKQAPIIGANELLNQPSFIVHSEDVAQVHQNSLPVRRHLTRGRLSERTHERALDECLASDEVAVNDDDASAYGAVIERAAHRSCVTQGRERCGGRG